MSYHHRHHYRRRPRRHSGFGYQLLESLFVGLILAPFYLMGCRPRHRYSNSAKGR